MRLVAMLCTGILLCSCATALTPPDQGYEPHACFTDRDRADCTTEVWHDVYDRRGRVSHKYLVVDDEEFGERTIAEYTPFTSTSGHLIIRTECNDLDATAGEESVRAYTFFVVYPSAERESSDMGTLHDCFNEQELVSAFRLLPSNLLLQLIPVVYW